MKLDIEILPLKQLTLDPNNARKHSDVNLRAIAESLTQFGQRKPIVINSDNVIVAGNGTAQAAILLNWPEINVVRIPADWTPDQQMAFALADNRSAELAEWDAELMAEQLVELETLGFALQPLGFEVPNLANFQPVEDSENPRLDERSRQNCPNCQTQLEMIKGVLTACD